MKTLTTILLLGFFALASCDDATNDNGENTAPKVMEVENRAINGQQWRITNFTHATIDKTPMFAGYIFEFDSHALLTSTNGSENLSGSWMVVNNDNGNNGQSEGEFESVDFSIDFTNPSAFADLSGKWKIVSITDSKIELKHSGSSGSQPDLIRFEKI